MMKVFKFGGASVKDASAIKNVANVIKRDASPQLLVVVSAMGKTTNHLEKVAFAYCEGRAWRDDFEAVRAYHFEILTQLFPSPNWIFQEVSRSFEKLEQKLKQRPSANAHYEYDQIVSYGEVVSSLIIDGFLKSEGLPSHGWDARFLVRTNALYREAQVDWTTTEQLIQREWNALPEGPKICVCQGFIGHTAENATTTLGREGSDYSAAIFAWCLQAESVTIWKDVPGMLNADPKWFDDTVRLPKISYKEALELSYYGATVIHPKTIKPLQNKNIPLYVRSFIDPSIPGTDITADTSHDHLIPSFIFKVNQVLISIVPKDFSFVVEENLRDLFALFSTLGVKINLMQNSALDFSVCVDDGPPVRQLIDQLRNQYAVRFNDKQELVTIRHYNQDTINRVLVNKRVLLEQRTRQTLRMVISDWQPDAQ